MAAKATFDLDNLLIIFDQVAPDGNGKVSIDTQVDIYSDAKEVWNTSALYPGFEFPFNTIGGEDLGGGLGAGDYYFLRTDLGWRIRPYEADHELTITGNLYPVDANDPLVVPTSSAYTVPVIFERSQLTQTVTPTTSVVVSAVVSATTDNTAIASAVWARNVSATVSGSYGEAMRTVVFGHVIYFDGDLGTAGTAYPLGTKKYPVNNFADAVAIASTENAPIIHMESEGIVQSTDSIDGMIVEGHHPLKVQVQVSAGASTVHTQFRTLYLRNAALNGWVVCRDAVLENVTGFQGVAHQCMLNPGTITLTGSQSSHFLDCYSGVPGTSTPVIDADGKNVDFALRNYNGGIEIQNNTAANNISIDMNSGQIILASTCTAGTIVCRGTGKLIDNSNGATVIDEITDTGALSADQDERLRELHQIQGLESGVPLVTTTSTRTAGASVTQTIAGDPATSITITRT